MSEGSEKIGVVGAGAWGTAIATRLPSSYRVILWARELEVVEEINKTSENRSFLPNIRLGANITAVNDLSDLSSCAILFFVMPAQFFRALISKIKPYLKREAVVIICSKGIEITHLDRPSGRLLSEIVQTELSDHPIAVMSGPSFAGETAKGLPTALTLASEPQLAERLARKFSSPDFRLYPSTDLIAVQLSGAIKNVLAIACGIASGRQLGQNAQALLIARGLAEIARLVKKMGGHIETLLGLSGVGDIILTCTSVASRNTSLGVALGQGERLEDILKRRQSVSEGVWTASALRHVAEKHGVEMPICFAVDDVLSGRCDIDSAIEQLRLRDIPAMEI